MYKLQKFMCHCNMRKYSFCARVVNIWKNEAIHRASPVYSQMGYIGTGLALCQLYLFDYTQG